MSAVRKALHLCADLLADAIEEDARAVGATSPAKPRKRSKEKLPEKIEAPQIDEFTRRRAHVAMRRAGLL